MSAYEDFGSWGDDASPRASVVERPRRPVPGGGALVDRLLADLGSDPEQWFAVHQQVTNAIREKRQEIARENRRLAEFAALYEAHGQQPSMFDNLRKVKLAEQVEAIRAAVSGKPPAEAALDTQARKSQPYQEFITHHAQQKRRWLEEKEDVAKLWAELRELEAEQTATMERIGLLRSLIYYLGQEGRAGG